MSSRAPLTLLLNAIVQRLENDLRWTWPIYQAESGENPGSKYLYIDASLAPILDPVKGYVDAEYPIIFDAYHIEKEMVGRLSSTVPLEMLESMENAITLDSYRERRSLFDFSQHRDCFRDVGHKNDTPAHIMSESNNMVHARQIIGFMLSYVPGGG